MFTLAEELCDGYEAAGLTGKSLLWEMRKNRLFADLHRWLDTDNALRARLGTVPESVEMRIGFEGEPPLVIALSDGRELRFRGFADRVDLRVSNGAPVVHDYKTGKVPRQSEVDKDPVLGGTKLQLGLYAEAARQRFGTDEAESHYWQTRPKGNEPLTATATPGARGSLPKRGHNHRRWHRERHLPMVPGDFNHVLGNQRQLQLLCL